MSSHIKENNNDVLIISFGSLGRRTAPQDYKCNYNDNKYFDFINFLPNNFKNVDLHFYADLDQCCYHKGLRGITNNVESTVEYLRQKISKRYKTVIFMGLSVGGYAALLFGSLLNINHVVVFYPTTQLTRNNPKYDAKYKDVLPYINKTTNYHLIAVAKPHYEYHNLQHCQRICISENVTLQVYDVVDDIKKLMKECNVVDILNKIINSS